MAPVPGRRRRAIVARRAAPTAPAATAAAAWACPSVTAPRMHANRAPGRDARGCRVRRTAHRRRDRRRTDDGRRARRGGRACARAPLIARGRVGGEGIGRRPTSGSARRSRRPGSAVGRGSPRRRPPAQRLVRPPLLLRAPAAVRAVRHGAVVARCSSAWARAAIELAVGAGIVRRHAVLRERRPARSPRRPVPPRPTVLVRGLVEDDDRREARVVGRREPDERRHRPDRVAALGRRLPRRARSCPRPCSPGSPRTLRCRRSRPRRASASSSPRSRRRPRAHPPHARRGSRSPCVVDRRVEQVAVGHVTPRCAIVVYTSTICIAVTATP